MSGALAAVRQLEAALSEQDAQRVDADDRLNTARATADDLLAAARTAGTQAGQRRRATILAAAEEDARAIRAAGDLEAAEIGTRAAAGRDRLVVELTALLLAEEA